ncbi:alpha-hydroxy acid oxidase [Branchiibius sp. NY16-3462-2]|uniref:alpha-hydroxy acid oxidase n=1 Tax=Branchiibius sp. NY16-3462-2 TaxID=1807500 RepID=UPI000AB6A39D|nr:alpha-hydroxy acid oxidase [Branchiibius sp. NY16-3462-2]
MEGNLEAAARAALDPHVWHYISRGSGDNVSVDEATDAWRQYRFRPRVLQDVRHVDTGLELFGHWRTPIGIAPSAFHQLYTPRGELATAAAALACGAPMVLSSRTTTRLEDVAAALGGPWWFQVYVMREPSITAATVRRARDAGASALVLTGDTPYVGYVPPTGTARPLPLTDELALVNVAEHLPDRDIDDIWDLIDQDAGITTDTIAWLVQESGLPVIVKGVLRGDEAIRCVEAGASGIWVSNHGGRQLDGAVPTAHALPEVVAAVDGQVPVVVDGGIRSGTDALAALALGASAVFLGRPVIWGLADDAAAGAAQVVTQVADQLRHAMGLAGATRLADLDPSLVFGTPTFGSGSTLRSS